MSANVTGGMPAAGPVIERVGSANFSAFFSLLVRLAEYERIAPPGPEEEERLRSDCLLDPPRYEAYLCLVGGVPAGYVTFYLTYSTFLARPTLFLEDLFVTEEYRGSGIGRVLFDFCRGEAKNRGCGRLDWLVLAWNEPAIRFYEGRGGKRLGWYPYRLERGDF